MAVGLHDLVSLLLRVVLRTMLTYFCITSQASSEFYLLPLDSADAAVLFEVDNVILEHPVESTAVV